MILKGKEAWKAKQVDLEISAVWRDEAWDREAQRWGRESQRSTYHKRARTRMAENNKGCWRICLNTIWLIMTAIF